MLTGLVTFTEFYLTSLQLVFNAMWRPYIAVSLYFTIVQLSFSLGSLGLFWDIPFKPVQALQTTFLSCCSYFITKFIIISLNGIIGTHNLCFLFPRATVDIIFLHNPVYTWRVMLHLNSEVGCISGTLKTLIRRRFVVRSGSTRFANGWKGRLSHHILSVL